LAPLTSLPQPATATCHSQAPLLLDPEAVVAQNAIQESLSCIAGSAHGHPPVDDVNSKVSGALLGTRAEQGLYVLLLKFTRSPQIFREALMTCPELAECRQKLENCGFAIELDSGAKVFVQPDHYDALLEAIRLSNWSLDPSHVIVESNLEAVVVQLVTRLHGKHKIYPKSTNVVPLSFPSCSVQSSAPIEYSKTFINIKLPSSLRSSASAHTGACTASTTDADIRKGKQKIRKGR